MTYEPKAPRYNYNIVPALPSHTRRYDTVAPANQNHISVSPLVWTAEEDKPEIIDEWNRHVNPEGKQYYYNAERRIVTESNIADLRIRGILTHAADTLIQSLSSLTVTINQPPPPDQVPEGSEIHLDVNDDENQCHYYIADHQRSSIGWLDTQLTTETLGLPAVHSPSHLALKKLEEYSLHVEYFPCHAKISPKLVESVRAQLAFNCVDATTSQGTTSPYTASDCERFLKVLKHAPENSAERNWIIGRISSVLARSRFMNFFGEDSARLDRSQSVNPVQQTASRWRSWVSRCLLFDMPQKHQSRLEALWVDRIVYVTMWQQCMQGLVSELRDTLCMAIFVWFASLTSLLLPTNAGAPFRAMTMTTMILSFSSAISAIIHVRRHRNRPSDTATDASVYLETSDHSRYGLQPLSMILTIPSALLTWSFITCGLSIVMLILSCHDVVISAMLTGFWVVMAHVVVMVLRFPRSQSL